MIDTYFLDYNEAHRVASQQNRPVPHMLQICYYAGDKMETDLVNLIHLPFESFVQSLGEGVYRLPQKIDVNGLNLSDDVKEEIEFNFKSALEQAQRLRNEFNKNYITALQNAQLDFSEKLRFYIPANSSTQVTQYVSKGIADSLQEKGYDVFFDLSVGMYDPACKRNLLIYNPHAVININYFNRFFLAEKAFYFIWYQDPMPALTNDEKIVLRERDVVFSLLPLFDKLLDKKNIPYIQQGFCINDKVYKQNKDVTRKKKIVFIGSSYMKTIPYEQKFVDAVREITDWFFDGKPLSEEYESYISEKYKIDKNFVSTRLFPYIVRDKGLVMLSRLSTDYELEIYGWGWEHYREFEPFYKGTLKYGDEIAKVYSEATFAFAPHQLYVLQQRVFEAAACGTIPIVYDIGEERKYEEGLEYFQTKEDLLKILNSAPKEKDFKNLLKNHTYASFTDKIINKISEING